MGKIVFGGSTCQVLAKEIAAQIGSEIGILTTKKFPDGERYLQIESGVKGKECIVVQSTCRPQDENLVELLLTLSTLRDLGAKSIDTVVPYFGYGRQDKEFNPGECVSAKAVAGQIELNSDTLYTVNIHKKHILKFFKIPSKELDASSLLGKYFKTLKLNSPIVVGPDHGAYEMAKKVADILGCKSNYLEKNRIGPGKVEMNPKKIEAKGMDMVIVDDIIDSGGTIVEAINMLKAQGARSVTVGCVHPVLTGNVITKLYSSGAANVVATNTIPSQISNVSIAPLIAEAL